MVFQKKKMNWKILVSFIIVIALFAVCFTKVRNIFTRVQANVNYGEEYMDGREGKWDLKDQEENVLATIRVTDGYVLSGQTYGSCSIVLKEVDSIAGKVSVYKDTDLQQVIEDLAGEMESSRYDESSKNGKTYTKLHTEKEEYLLISHEKTVLVIRVLKNNIIKANLNVNNIEDQLIEMIEVK